MRTRPCRCTKVEHAPTRSYRRRAATVGYLSEVGGGVGWEVRATKLLLGTKGMLRPRLDRERHCCRTQVENAQSFA